MNWPEGVVPFIIDNNFPEIAKKMMFYTFDIISNVSCVSFLDIKNEEEITKPPGFILISQTNVYDCYSDIGYEYKQRNVLLNFPYCFITIGVILHNIMRILGFVPEHLRPDRMQFININWENVDPKHLEKFKYKHYEFEIEITLGLHYDFSSIMHYKVNEYALNKSLPTILKINAKKYP